MNNFVTYPLPKMMKTWRKCAYLMVIDSIGSVIPSKHSILRTQTSKSDAILSFGNVHRLPVDSRRNPDHSPTIVAKRHSVDCFLHRLKISGSILWDGEYTSCHCVEKCVILVSIEKVWKRVYIQFNSRLGLLPYVYFLFCLLFYSNHLF